MFKEIIIFIIFYVFIQTILWFRKRVKIHKVFANNGIKGPKPSLFSGNYYEIKDNPNETLDQWIGKYGNYFGYFLGDRPILVVNDLDAIQTILITKSKLFRDRPKFILDAKPLVSSVLSLRGDRWRHVRRVITPFFSHHKITSDEITNVLNDSIETCISKIRERKEQPIRVEERMQSLTLDIICKCALNMFDTDVYEDNSHLKNSAKEYMDSANNILVTSASFLPFLRPILTFVNNYLTAGRMVDEILRHLNKQIKTEEQMMSSNGFHLENTKSNNVLKSMLKCYLDKRLERDELTGNAIVLLLAGYDTTSMGLSYALYCLAKNPEIQERLRNEINSKGIQSKYLEMVWSESLRLYPPVATFVTREAAEDVVINDITIKKGVIVQIPLWHIHHNPEVWPEPYVFDPQRFTPENRELLHQSSFLTFGLGPRSCIGVELALHEARLTLSKIMQNFRIETCDQTPDPLEFKCPTEVLYPKHGIYLRFHSLSQ